MKKVVTQNPSSLYTPKNRGGKIGGDGYNFQDSLITSKVLEWLSIPDFQSFIKEGVDDASVHFNDGTDYTWLYQIKRSLLDKTEFESILQHFSEKINFPGLNIKKCIIGCCGLGETVRSLWQMITDYRGAQSTMTDSQLAATKAELDSKITELGLNKYEDLLISLLHIEPGFQGMPESDIPSLQNNFVGLFNSVL